MGKIRRKAPKKIFQGLPTLVFSLPTLPCVTVAHPAYRTEADLRETASLATNQQGPSPSLPSVRPSLTVRPSYTDAWSMTSYRKTVTSVHYHASQKYTTFTTIRFITFTVSHIHTVTEPSTHCQSQSQVSIKCVSVMS